jgi:hypothetical protein
MRSFTLKYIASYSHPHILNEIDEWLNDQGIFVVERKTSYTPASCFYYFTFMGVNDAAEFDKIWADKIY